jgi:D-alanyl-D-alanine-carboxypeptidase/D-alanyl-D-alanine-endopeptidase
MAPARSARSSCIRTTSTSADPGVALPIETLRAYVGSYPLAPTFVIAITEEGGSLFAQATGQPKIQVYASAKDEFFYKIVNAQISFQRDGAGKVSGLVLHQNGGNVPATKTP